jgi:hypothetical protein
VIGVTRRSALAKSDQVAGLPRRGINGMRGAYFQGAAVMGCGMWKPAKFPNPPWRRADAAKLVLHFSAWDGLQVRSAAAPSAGRKRTRV